MYSLKSLRKICRHYSRNGLILDIFAASPFKIILDILEITDPMWFIVPLRALRLIASAGIPRLLEKIEIVFL